MLWFNFILGSNFIFLCFKLIIIYYHTQKQRKIKFEPSIKLNHKIVLYYFVTLFSPICVFSNSEFEKQKSELEELKVCEDYLQLMNITNYYILSALESRQLKHSYQG